MAIDLVARLSLDDQMSGPLAALNGKLMGMVGFAAVSAGATSAVKTFANFDTAIRKAATIAGASDTEFEAMAESAKELGASTSLSATQVAAAMTEMAAKGYEANQVIDAMPGVIAAAEASGEDLAMTSDVVSTALNVWGMEASEASDVADILAMTANKTAAGIGDMQYALKYAGAPAKALGMSLEEVAAAAGIMANAGIDGSSAGTSMRQGLSQLVNPTKAASNAMEQYGFSAIDANGKVKSMTDIVGNLQSSMEGMTEAQRVAFMKTLVGTESMSAFMTLVEAGPEKLGELQKSLENSGGSAQEAADKMKAGIGGALEQASGAIETFMIDVGDALAPMVVKFADAIASMDTKPVVDGLQKFGEKLSELATKILATDWSPFVEGMKTLGNVAMTVATFVVAHFDTIATAVKWAAAAFIAFKAINVIIGVVNTVITVINAATRVFRVLKSAVTIARTAFTLLRAGMLLFPGTWIIAAIGAVIAIGIALYKNWDTVKAKTAQLWAKFKETSAFKAMQSGLEKLIGVAKKVVDGFNGLRSGVSNAMEKAKAAVFSSINGIIDKVNWLIEKLNAIPGVNVPLVAHVSYSGPSPGEMSAVNGEPLVRNSGPMMIGHHGGWNEIRTDRTPRLLHAGERVLTAVENDNYKQMMSSGLPGAIARMSSAPMSPADAQAISNSVSNNSVSNIANTSNNSTVSSNSTSNSDSRVVNVGGISFPNLTIREEADVQRIATVIAQELEKY